MVEILSNFSIIENVCTQLIQPKKCFYLSQQICNQQIKAGKQLKQIPHLSFQNFQMEEPNTVPLNIMLIKNSKCSDYYKPCIIYLHGLASYSCQGKFLIPYLQNLFSLCLFDSRGHGKSKHNNITYGLHESEDLYRIILQLKKKGITDFILWGRSMGSVTTLMMLQNQLVLDKLKKDIRYVVLDSPFSSFRKISQDVIAKNLYLPQFLAKLIVDSLLKNLNSKHALDFSLIDVSDCNRIQIPALFIYSQKDSVIDASHTNQIYDNYKGQKSKMQINCDHNEIRPSKIIEDIMNKLKECTPSKTIRQKSYSTQKRGILLTGTQRVPINKKMTHLSYTRQKSLFDIHETHRQQGIIPKKLGSRKYLTPKGKQNKKLTNNCYLYI